MDQLILFTEQDLKNLTKKGSADSKFGTQVQLLSSLTNIYDDIVNLDVDYVVFGIPEDLGNFANTNKTGTFKTWKAVLKKLTNLNRNTITTPEKVLILGHLDFKKIQKKLLSYDQNNKKDMDKARRKMELIDKKVAYVVHQIIKAGKKPIIIGGGQNNAYGVLKGASLALNTRFNSINISPQSGFMKKEGRHSGNGFSYAYAEGFLKNYFILGLNTQITAEIILKTLGKIKAVKYGSTEDFENKFKKQIRRATKHVTEAPFGLDVNYEIVNHSKENANIIMEQVTEVLRHFSQLPEVSYLHISSAVVDPDNRKAVAKNVTHMIVNFINGDTN
ncbi:arginase family protein [Mangrovimonas sp. TPBH4]|uniref:arginase family protein n=1 Tax=Mangrovimonas sp. TPBH4 TaxID=1645914 RepID=UPI0006B4D311|nr:arginase family protein [Mangrovimonas sp. TPBH4]